VSEPTATLFERRAKLIALAEAQRRRLAADVEVWRRPLGLADRGISAARFVANHPAWIAGAAMAPLAFRPTRLGTWFRRGFLAFQFVRQLRAREPRA